jgi:hypothetical protein
VFVITRDNQYYNLYTPTGPSFTPDIKLAYRFAEKSYAENVLGGDDRLKDAKIEEL